MVLENRDKKTSHHFFVNCRQKNRPAAVNFPTREVNDIPPKMDSVARSMIEAQIVAMQTQLAQDEQRCRWNPIPHCEHMEPCSLLAQNASFALKDVRYVVGTMFNCDLIY